MAGERPNYPRRRVIAALVVIAAIAIIVAVVVLVARGIGGAETGEATSPPAPSSAPSATPTPAGAEEVDAETPPPLPAIGTCWGDPGDVTVLVNKHHPLCPVDYYPELVSVDSTGGELRPEAASAMNAMNAALEAETGLWLFSASAFRSYDTQISTYGGWVEQDGQAVADTYSARPGHSEHQTGLAMDVGASSCGCTDEPFGYTPEGEWVAQNAWRFGFIVRYPPGYEWMTGYIWEPWHLRYVGQQVAATMHDAGIATLEDYYGTGPAADYAG